MEIVTDSRPTSQTVRAASAAPETPDLTAIDLFAGAGGLSCGFEWAGAGAVVGAVEINQAASQTFLANHPAGRVWTDDIRDTDKVSPDIVRDHVGEIDVLLGGPMCQGVSQRGPRDPFDRRNFAFWVYADYVRKLRPRFFVMENVPAVASDVHNRQLAIAVFEELESLGYHLSAEVVCAAWFGVPQLRYRLVVLGSLDGTPAFPWQVAAAIQGRLPESSYVPVGDAIMDLPAVRSGGGREIAPLPAPRGPLSEYARLMREGADCLRNHWSADTDQVNLDRIKHVTEGGNWHDIPLELLPPRFRDVRLSDHTTTYKRLHRDHPANVMTCLCSNVTAGAFTHPTQNRAITVREAARFQGFPDRFRFVGPRSSQYRQVGNAVPGLMAKRLVEALVLGHGLEEPGGQLQMEPWRGRVTLEVLKAHPDKRLPFALAPRYKTLFARSVHRRRTDLLAA